MAEEKKAPSRRGRRSKTPAKKQEVVDQPKVEEVESVEVESAEAVVVEEQKVAPKKDVASGKIIVGSIVEKDNKQFEVLSIGDDGLARLSLLTNPNKRYRLHLGKLKLVK